MIIVSESTAQLHLRDRVMENVDLTVEVYKRWQICTADSDLCNVQSCFAKMREICIMVIGNHGAPRSWFRGEMNALCNFNYTPKRH